jgi:hypothetical protein
MNLKNILFFCIFLYTAPFALPQNQNDDTEKEDLSKLTFRQRLVYNIGGGVTFGTITNVNLLPQIGYRITPRLISGIGGNFQYYRDNRFTGNNEFIVYGGNAFSRFFITPNLFAQAEYQALVYNNTLGNYAMIGGGFMPDSHFFISAYYLLLYPTNNIYGVPYVLRVGFAF